MTELTTQEDAQATDYEVAIAEIRQYVEGRPDELVRKSTSAMEQLRDSHSLRRVELEVDHQARLQRINAHYTERRNAVNESIRELERQLGQLRNEWEILGRSSAEDLAAERERWERLDRDQRKLIAAEQAMIDHLKS